MAITLSPKVNNAYKYLAELVDKKSPGDKLPPVQELMKSLSVSQVTIQNACDILEAQGVIERKRREGIFITDRLKAGEFAIVAKPDLLNPEKHPSYPLGIKLLTERIHQFNHNYQAKLHMGKHTPTGLEFPSSLDLNDPQVLTGIRGVFSFAPLYELEDTLNQYEVPSIGLGTDKYSQKDLQYSVNFESWDKILQQAVKHLAAIECKSVGLLWSRPGYRNITPDEDCETILTNICRQTSLRCKSTWMKPIVLLEQQTVEDQHGISFIHDLYQLPEQPEALIVLDEILCRGVLYEMVNLGISIPTDIKLLSLTTKGIKLPYRYSITRIELDIEKQIQTAVDLMFDLISGNTPDTRHIHIPGNLQIGEVD